MEVANLAEIQALAFALPEAQRAQLAAELLESLPGMFLDEDEGHAEAERRSLEMDLDPSIALSHEEFLAAVRRQG